MPGSRRGAKMQPGTSRAEDAQAKIHREIWEHDLPTLGSGKATHEGRVPRHGGGDARALRMRRAVPLRRTGALSRVPGHGGPVGPGSPRHADLL